LAAAATNRTEDYKSYQMGVRYSLSKRTTAYAFYGQTRNDSAALAGAASFYKDSKTVVGVAHSF
jgi:predicted porin